MIEDKRGKLKKPALRWELVDSVHGKDGELLLIQVLMENFDGKEHPFAWTETGKFRVCKKGKPIGSFIAQYRHDNSHMTTVYVTPDNEEYHTIQEAAYHIIERVNGR